MVHCQQRSLTLTSKPGAVATGPDTQVGLRSHFRSEVVSIRLAKLICGPVATVHCQQRSLTLTSEPGAVATGPDTQVGLRSHFRSEVVSIRLAKLISVRSLPLPVLISPHSPLTTDTERTEAAQRRDEVRTRPLDCRIGFQLSYYHHITNSLVAGG